MITVRGLIGSGILGLMGILFQSWWISRLRRVRMEQILKSYGPHALHEGKKGIPSMGGAVFLLLGAMAWGGALWAGIGSPEEHLGVWGLAFSAAIVGGIDDIRKFFRQSSEGLSSRQKFLFQLALTLPWAMYAASYRSMDLLPPWIVPWPVAVLGLVFIATGMLNAVNVTDGLDGLAAGATFLSLLTLGILAPTGSAAWWGALAGSALSGSFLWHNAHPASVFMGDMGSHFLGGLLVGTSVFSGSILSVVTISPLFFVEIVSVAIQIAAIRWFGKRIFRMSPLHHHFELKGWPETRIVARFWLLHSLGILVLGSLTGIFR